MARKPDNSEPVCLPLNANPAGQGLLLTTLAMLALGVIVVHAAMARPVVRTDIPWHARVDARHTLFAALSCLALFTLWRLDYHWLTGRKKFPMVAAISFGISIICSVLIFVPGLGQDVGGYVRWLKIAPGVGFQPSELVKFAVLIFLSAWLTKDHIKIRSFTRTFIPAMGIIGVAVAVTVKQDFSTGAVIGMVGVAALLLAGVPWYYLLTVIPPAALGFYKFVYTDPYRWNRIIAWTDPYSDKNPCTYQARESLIAIITGGWAGKGLGKGSVYMGYLPESTTDFAFSAYCEQLGFAGGLLLMGLIFLWMWNARKAALRAPDRFGYLLVGSMGFLVAMQAVMHIAVALVSAPTTGMGLPFVSAGGTSLVISAAAVAIMISVSARAKAAQTPAAELEAAAAMA
jgi:cell division protein FtsW